MRVVKLLGGTFPDKLVIPKLPSAENSVNFKPVVVPSDSIVNKDLPVLSETFSFLKGPIDMLTLYENKYKQEVQKFAAEQIGRRRRDDYTDGAVRIKVPSPSP